MKQLIQDLMKGNLKIIDNPLPQVRDNHVLIKSELFLSLSCLLESVAYSITTKGSA